MRLRVSSLLICALTLVVVASTAQARLFPELSMRRDAGDPNARNPIAGTEGPKNLTGGDLNGDGFSDIVTANLDGSVSVLLADGEGGLREQFLVPAAGLLHRSSLRAVVTDDFNGDGALDVAAADIAQGGVVVLLGSGDGVVQPFARVDVDGAPVRALAAGDINGDGAADLVAGCGEPDCDRLRRSCGTVLLLTGTGDGSFAAPQTLAGSGSCKRCFYDVAVADLNSDRRLDVLAVDYMQREILIFAGHGDGTFASLQCLQVEGWGPRALRVAYLDERLVDGVPPPGATMDFLVANRDSATVEIYLGQGGQAFSDPITMATGDAPRDVAAGDLDGDGLVELVIVNRNAHSLSVFRGLGGAAFARPTLEIPTGTSPRQVVLADMTGDGSLDAAVNNRISEDVSVLIGHEGFAGFLVSSCYYPSGMTPVSVVAEDFNEDGMPDVATASLRSHDLRVRCNEGGGILGSEALYPVDYGPASLAGGDVNGDGHVDLVVTCTGSPASQMTADGNPDQPPQPSGTSEVGSLVTLLGRGDGTFSAPTSIPGGTLRPYWLRLGDLSGDGVLDAAVGGLRGELVLFRGRGDATFDSPVFLRAGAAGTPLTINLGDFNGDARLDIATSRGKVLLNDGHFFTANWSGSVKGYPVQRGDWVVESADLDQDGVLDLIVALTFVQPDPIAVYFGVGDGTFLEPTIYETGMGVTALAAQDMDGDGILDIVSGNRCTADVSIMRGLGDRSFELMEIVRAYPVESVVVTDMTGDDRPDLVGVGVGLWMAVQGGSCSVTYPQPPTPSAELSAPGIYINEIMARNREYFVDTHGNTPDWVELYNHSDAVVDLTGWLLRQARRDEAPVDWHFPEGSVVAPRAYLTIFCGSAGRGDALYAPFALSSRGESLSLVNGAGKEVNHADFPPMPGDVSYARFVDAGRYFCYNPVPTMGKTNVQPGNINPGVDTRNPVFTDGRTRLAVSAQTFDDTGLAFAAVLFRRGHHELFVELRLEDDGLNGDGVAADGVFGAVLPPFPPGSTIFYYLRVIDLEGKVTLDPGDPADPANLYQITLPEAGAGLRISEVVADNNTGIQDEKGQREDWLEIVNCGDQVVSLTDVALTKDYYDPAETWLFPEGLGLAPGEQLVVFCDDDTNQGPLHTHFRLDKAGDEVVLMRVGEVRTLLDAYSFGPLPADTAFGRTACGSEPGILAQPTPRAPNSGAGVRFRRGDVNADGHLDLSDPIYTLMFLFVGGPEPMCLDAADAEDSGGLNVGDAIYLLSCFFARGEPPRPPFSGCGLDPTGDSLSCRRFTPCQ